MNHRLFYLLILMTTYLTLPMESPRSVTPYLAEASQFNSEEAELVYITHEHRVTQHITRDIERTVPILSMAAEHVYDHIKPFCFPEAIERNIFCEVLLGVYNELKEKIKQNYPREDLHIFDVKFDDIFSEILKAYGM